MSPEQKEALVTKVAMAAASKAAAEVVKKLGPVIIQHHGLCRCGQKIEDHDQHHALMKEFVEWIGEIKKIKWGLLRFAVYAVAAFLGGCFVLGFKDKILKWLGVG